MPHFQMYIYQKIVDRYIGKLGNKGHYNIQSSTLHLPLHSKLEHMLFPTEGV